MPPVNDVRCSLGAYSPIFDPVLQKPGKAFYALKYLNELYRLGRAVKCEVEGGQGNGGLWAVAAKGGGANTPCELSAVAFIVNDLPEACIIKFDFGGRKPKFCRIVDARRTDAKIALPFTLPPNSFLLVEFE